MLQTILSLAKLCALASDEPPASVQSAVENIEYGLGLVGLQEELPQSVLNYLGQDADNMAVLTPSQLVDVSLVGIPSWIDLAYICFYNL